MGMGMNAFGRKLKALRTKAGLTMAALGERSGMTWNGIAQFESGRRQPSWESVQALCKALGVKCSEFERKGK